MTTTENIKVSDYYLQSESHQQVLDAANYQRRQIERNGGTMVDQRFVRENGVPLIRTEYRKAGTDA